MKIWDDLKKIYHKDNAKKHIILLIFVSIFTVLSSLFDIKTGQPETWRQNIFDWILNICIAIYSINFLHENFSNSDKICLPDLKNITPKSILGLLALNIVWSFYLLIIAILLLIWFAYTKDLYLPIISSICLIFILPFVYYCFIKFAKEYDLKGTLAPLTIINFIKQSFKNTTIIYLQYILGFIIFFIVYIFIYFIASFVGIAELFQVAPNFFAFDFIVSALFEYGLNILIFFLLPYTLLNEYKSFSTRNEEKSLTP